MDKTVYTQIGVCVGCFWKTFGNAGPWRIPFVTGVSQVATRKSGGWDEVHFPAIANKQWMQVVGMSINYTLKSYKHSNKCAVD